jgi:hypothetical protein
MSYIPTSLSSIQNIDSFRLTNSNSLSNYCIFLSGHTNLGDGGEGEFIYNSSDTTSADNGGTVIVDASHRRWHRSLANQPVSVKHFGAVGDGITDDTAAFVAALATGNNIYMPTSSNGYLIKNTLTIATAGQMLFGDHRTTSYFVINTSFNMAATGVIIINAAYNNAPSLYRIGMQFVQPDTSNYSSLTIYPVAVYAQLQSRFEVRECLISNASVVMDLRQNSGGAYIEDLQMSFYTSGILIDGAEDIMRINNLHSWPFNMTASQSNLFLYSQSVGYAISSGRCDGLLLSDCLFINSQQVFLYEGTTTAAPGNTFGSFSNCGFDTNIGLVMQAGDIAISGGYFSRSSTISNEPALYFTGGNLRITGATFIYGFTSTFPVVSANSLTTSPKNSYLQISNCIFEGGTGDTTSVYVAKATGAEMTVTLDSCIFDRATNTIWANPVVQVGSGRLGMVNCRISDIGTGYGVFIDISIDDWHRIIGNASLGWANKFPTASLAVYQYN